MPMVEPEEVVKGMWSLVSLMMEDGCGLGCQEGVYTVRVECAGLCLYGSFR